MLRVSSAGALKSDGTYQGCYVYLLLCEGEGAVYVKAGMSADPLGRLSQLLVGCPLKPGLLAVAELRNRDTAFRAERALQVAFARWHSSGEWFRVPVDERTQFNAARKVAMAAFEAHERPTEWTKLSIERLQAAARSRREMARKRLRRNGRAFRDFARDSGYRGL